MDSNGRHSIIRTDLLISVLTLIFIYLSYVGSQQSSDPCERPITCEENGTRMANVENCSSYFECSHIDGGVIPISLWWVLRRCAQNERYDHLRQTCVNVSDHTQPCYNNCSANRVDMILSQHSVYDHLFEGSMVQFVCCFRYLFFESQVHVQSLQWSVDGRRISNYGKRITIIIVSDDSDNLFCSTLTFDPIRQRDSGCIQCTAIFNANGSHVIMKELYTFVHPWKRPSVSVYPLTQHVFDSEQFVLHCSLPAGYRGNFTWFEEGHVINPSCGGVNISQPTRGSSVLQKSIRWQRGSMTFSCMAKTAFIDTDPTYATVFVMNSNDKFCDWDFDGENSIKWSRTKVGHEDKQRCPGNSTGVCFRECLWIESFAVWSQPDCHECVTQGFQNILNQLNEEDELNNQTVVAEIARDLFDMTKSVGLSLGNLNASLQAIDMLGDLRTDSSPNHDEIISVIRTISNVLQPSNSYAWERLRAMNDTVATILLSSAEVYGRSLAMMNDTNWTTVEADYMILEAVSLDISNLTQTVTFPSGSSWKWNEDRLDTISISAEALDSASTNSGQRLRLWSAYYRNIDAQLQNGASIGINSRVLSLTIDGLQTSEELKQPVIVTLQHNRQDNIENLPRTCVFWKFSDTDGGEWDSTGCSLVSTTSTHTVCSCNHLTNFAILMSLNPSDDVVLSIISTVGCCISVAALILTVIVYAVNWKQMKSDQAAVLLNLCLALIIANIIFLVGADKVVPEDGCKAVAVLLHYFFLAAFFLMLAEGIELLLYILFVFHVRRKIETASIIAAAWIIPLVIVIISVGATKVVGYGSSKSCWLSVETGLIWAFLVPALCIIVANFVILAIVLRRISQARFSAAKNEKKSRIRGTLWNISVICPVLGVTWVFGVLSVSFGYVVFQYLFAIANSVQGVLIFIFHALFHNKTMSDKIFTFISNCVRSHQKPELSGSQTSGSLDQSPKKVPKKGNVPELVAYYQGLENENGSSAAIRKAEVYITSSTDMSSSATDDTTMSTCDSVTTTEVCNTNTNTLNKDQPKTT